MKKRLLYIILCALTVLFLQNPAGSVFYAKKGLKLCESVIIPSLFPFFVCSGLLVYSGFCEVLARLLQPVMRPLFGVGGAGAAAFVLGLVSGYPLGAVTACQLYEKSYLTKTETERLLAFCNNSGPLFILGAVGISLYASPKIGVLLYLSHILASLLAGVMFRFYRRGSFTPVVSLPQTEEKPFGEVYANVMSQSVQSILLVSGTVIFASTAANLAADLFFSDSAFRLFFVSLAEFTSGISNLSETDLPLLQKLVLSSGIVGFAGLSVHLQVLGVVARYHLNLFPYFFGKLLHAVFSMLFTLLFLRLSPADTPVFQSFSASLSGGFCISSLYTTLAVLFLALAALLALMVRTVKNMT